MRRAMVIVVLAGAAAGGVVARRAVQSPPESAGEESTGRWHSVTLNRSQDEVMTNGQMPGPLAGLGDLVEVQVRPAPGGKGTELAARLRVAEPTGPRAARARVSGHDPRQQVRLALRQSKQLVEVGEVLRMDPTPHGRRRPTPTGKLIDVVTRRAGGEGVL